ncbi:tetratricopeptide repeat protein [Pontibacter silvestris]|uniref:histidine kinase n=1 Tax=Pontibacter silvestris TaxID=2305183 RepID=A0ABW4WZB4_9BACT|nr:tetratricopeptide repeat protein [Pontibacter silvestris]MCC9135443.1 tetratricopeptide repeat protein [Pontibacter silvestris]
MKFLLLIVCFLSTFSIIAQQSDEKELKAKLEASTDPAQQVRLLCELSKLSCNVSLSSSLTYGKKAAALAKEEDNKAGLALAYNSIGIAYDTYGDYSKATDYYYKSLRIREAIADSSGISASYNNIGSIYSEQQKYPEATELFIKSLHIAESIHDTASAARSINNLGSIYQQQGDLKKALTYILRGLQLKEQVNDLPGVLISLNNAGFLYSETGEWEKAINYHRRALKLNTTEGNSLEKAYALYGMAQAYMFGKRPDLALPYALQNLKVVQAINSKNEIQIAAELLNNIYIELGDYENAHEYLTLQNQYKDSLHNTEVDLKIAELQLAYEKEKTEQENLLLKAQHNLQEEELERRKAVLYSTVSLFIMACFIALIFFKGRQGLRVANKLLLQKNQEVLHHSAVLSKQKEELATQAALLQTQKEELERLNTVKDRLFSVIAHDLRGPLVSLKGLIGIVASGAVPMDKLKGFMSTLETSQQNALALLDNLLIWAKSQMQGMEIKPETLQLYKLVQENVTLLQPQAVQKEITLKNDVKPEATIFADKEMVKLILRNLISNAIKFCNANDVIRITAVSVNTHMVITVKDSGVGMSEDTLAQLFSSQNYTTRGTANEKGSGIGLTLCKELITYNNGHINVKSEPGKGSAFIFTVPIGQSVSQKVVLL